MSTASQVYYNSLSNQKLCSLKVV